nr:nucleotidyltransferase [uncultured Cetobacterium sp.]
MKRLKEELSGVGIVVEYNPFHNGHRYHCLKAKEYGDVVIAVMSGNFVQRGEPAIVNKWERAKMALNSGVDIVVELPTFYSVQSAEIFSIGSVGILNKLGVDKIVFGSESGDVKKLIKISKIEEGDEFKESIKLHLKSGLSYPTAYSKALESCGVTKEVQSNDILGVEYIKAIDYWGSSIKPIAIKREKAGYYTEGEVEGISSATGIRKMLYEETDFKNVVPDITYSKLMGLYESGKVANLKDFYPYIRYKIISERENIEKIQDVEEGYSVKLYNSAMKHKKFDEFFEEIKTKRYTIGRVQRILIHILLNITKKVTQEVKKEIPYIQVLGFTENGRKYIKELKKKDEEIKILTSLKNIKRILKNSEREKLELNEASGRIYSLINDYEEEQIPIMIK